jgi:hypothetical protein
MKKEKKGKFTFGDDFSAKILGKGIVGLENHRTKAENMLLFEKLKPNLLSVIQTCDQ